jgi:type I restriction enzyme M protein
MSSNNGNDYCSLVSKVWSFAHVLRERGIRCGNAIEQITFLLFLKMDRKRTWAVEAIA